MSIWLQVVIGIGSIVYFVFALVFAVYAAACIKESNWSIVKFFTDIECVKIWHLFVILVSLPLIILSMLIVIVRNITMWCIRHFPRIKNPFTIVVYRKAPPKPPRQRKVPV